MTQVKFYRVETLPETGEVGSMYFCFGEGSIYLCTYPTTFEFYGTDLTECLARLDEIEIVTSAALNQLNTVKQDKEDETLLTTDKTVVGAINEIKELVDISIPLLQASL